MDPMVQPGTHKNVLNYLWARAKVGTHTHFISVIFEAFNVKRCS